MIHHQALAVLSPQRHSRFLKSSRRLRHCPHHALDTLLVRIALHQECDQSSSHIFAARHPQRMNSQLWCRNCRPVWNLIIQMKRDCIPIEFEDDSLRDRGWLDLASLASPDDCREINWIRLHVLE